MGIKLSDLDAVKAIEVAEVIRQGEAYIIPEKGSIDGAIAQLQRLQRMEEETYDFIHTFEAFVWDGAVALSKAIGKVFGFGFGEITRSFFGDKPPQLVEVQTGPNPSDRVRAPWGQMSLPGISGQIFTSGGVENGKFVFKLIARVKRKHEKQIAELAKQVQFFLDTESIYRGKGIKIAFDEGHVDPWTGENVPATPEFLRIGEADAADLILNRDVHAEVETHLFTPIDRLSDLRALGMSRKRGVLLSGTFGTGKSLTATIAANKARKAGITFVLSTKAEDFAQAYMFAQMYQPAIVFCEDIDRSLQGGRSAEMDKILNTIDGVESKNTEIMVVLTTNDIESINPAALRPGRLDKAINFALPDAEATERLIRLYSKGAIAYNADISAAGKELAGSIPAVIAEAVNAAKLAQLKLSPAGRPTTQITPQAMLEAARGMKLQMDLLNRPRPRTYSNLEKAAAVLGDLLERTVRENNFRSIAVSQRLGAQSLKELSAESVAHHAEVVAAKQLSGSNGSK